MRVARPAWPLLILLGLICSGRGLATEAIEVGPEAGEFPFAGPFVSVEFMELIGEQIEFDEMLTELLTGVYVPRKSNLMWQRRDNGRDTSWRAAKEHCRDLELAGFDDWRLPTIEELESLHITMSSRQYKLSEKILLTACCPWSETKVDEARAWNYNFRTRSRFSGSFGYSFDHRALCLRVPFDDEPLPEDLVPPIPLTEDEEDPDSKGFLNRLGIRNQNSGGSS